MKLLINCSSLLCWVTWKYNITWNPDLRICIKIHPSAAVNPANQKGLDIFLFWTIGLSIWVVLGKALANSGEILPRLINRLSATIFFKPSTARCSLFLNI